MKRSWVVAIVVAGALVSGQALAHGSASHGHKAQKRAISTEEHPFGREGDPRKVSRTITVDMTDNMRFSPGEITVKRGETVRFMVRNNGKILHELVIGTIDDLKKHAELMKKFPDMEHDDPYMAHVDPGKTQPLVWQFTRAGEFYYGCLLPGHFEAGMIGKVVVR